MAKEAHSTVYYDHGTPQRHCSICTMYRPGPHCTAVVDPIYPMGNCKLFRLKTPSSQKSEPPR